MYLYAQCSVLLWYSTFVKNVPRIWHRTNKSHCYYSEQMGSNFTRHGKHYHSLFPLQFTDRWQFLAVLVGIHNG